MVQVRWVASAMDQILPSLAACPDQLRIRAWPSGRRRGKGFDQARAFRAILGDAGPLGRLAADPAVPEKLEEDLGEHVRLVGLTLMAAVVREEELHVGQHRLELEAHLEGSDHVLPAPEEDRRNRYRVQPPEEVD